MESTHTSLTPPPCPLCGSRAKVVRMATSLTPFERPWMKEFETLRFFCQGCAHDFEHEPDGDEN